MGFLLKLLCPVFRSTKEDTAGLEEVSNPQDTLIEENSADSCNTAATPPSGKPSHHFQKFSNLNSSA